MSMAKSLEFAGRVQRQVEARYPAVSFSVDPARFALTVQSAGVDITVPLTPLQLACERDPDRTPQLILDFAASLERQLTPRRTGDFAISRLIWCVRSRRYLDDIGARADLLVAPVAADLEGFIAAHLPGSVMRGVARATWHAIGTDDAEVVAAAARNTAARFRSLIATIAAADRIPADGWRIGADALYQGSMLMVGDVLRALTRRSGGEVLLANPDRSSVLVLPAHLPASRHFAARVEREWRMAPHPASRAVLISDGETLRAVEDRSSPLMPWLAG